MTTSPEDAPVAPEPVNLMEVFRYLAALHDRVSAGASVSAPVGPGGDQDAAQARMSAAVEGLMGGMTMALQALVPLLEACGAIQRKEPPPALVPPDRALRLMKSLRPDPRIERPDLNGGPIS